MPSDYQRTTGLMQVVETATTLNPAAWLKILGADPRRWSAMISITSSTVNLSTNPALAAGATQGLLQSSVMPPLLLVYRDIGEAIKGAWFAKGGGAGITLTTIECLILPEAPEEP